MMLFSVSWRPDLLLLGMAYFGLRPAIATLRLGLRFVEAGIVITAYGTRGKVKWWEKRAFAIELTSFLGLVSRIMSRL